MKKVIFCFAFAAFCSFTAKAQFIVTADTNAVQLVNDFILTGVTASNVIYTGADSTLGSFSGGSATNLGMNEGIVMTTGILDTSLNPGIGDTVGAFACFANFGDGDSLLNTLIAPWTTYDASILEFDLVPIGNVLEFQYVFASEEYPEWVGSSFNDVFGFFISGPDTTGGNYLNFNIARLVDGQPVAINNVNADTNSLYFVDNEALGGTTIVFDGFTTVLTAKVYVIPAATYHLKMAIADAGDRVFDSGIFLKAQSMKSYFITGLHHPENLDARIFPNPVNPQSLLTIPISKPGTVSISIKDLNGRITATSAIEHSQPGDCTISIGKILNACPAGMYFISIQTPDGRTVSKVVK